MELPGLSATSILHSDCCCCLSNGLIEKLASVLPSDPDLILSIGSGSGLLEALLLHQRSGFNIHGVEVSGEINRYLPEERLQLVHGTWDLASSANDARAWMFVYPREADLIRKYLQVHGRGKVSTVVWIGPWADLEGFESLMIGSGWSRDILHRWNYEALDVWKRSTS